MIDLVGGSWGARVTLTMRTAVCPIFTAGGPFVWAAAHSLDVWIILFLDYTQRKLDLGSPFNILRNQESAWTSTA